MLRLLFASVYLMLIIVVLTPNISLAQYSLITTPEQTKPTGNVHIVAEGVTTVPTLYSGRREPVAGSPLHLVAVAYSDSKFTESALQYLWSINGTKLATQQNFADIVAPDGTDVLVQLTIRDSSGNLFAQTAKYIRLSKPFLNFYEDNPLRGLSQSKINTDYYLIGDEITIRAIPFFMDTSIYSNIQEPEWRVNNQQIENVGSDPFSITLQRSEGFQNLFMIDFQIRSAKVITQFVQNKFNFSFDI